MLSFFSIFGIQNNKNTLLQLVSLVVNCFHFSVSLGYKTTFSVVVPPSIPLWIAFIFQYLWDTKQRSGLSEFLLLCCELLSFFSIFGIQNNLWYFHLMQLIVVNCFHFSVSLGYKTTNAAKQIADDMLWIAFIFQYLWDTKQRRERMSKRIEGCELLSFFSIFGIQNNLFPLVHFLKRVVNCFHFSVSLGYKTTPTRRHTQLVMLWIAFIFQYLWDTKQLVAKSLI